MSSAMLDFARATCDAVPDDADYTGEFHPDPEAVEAWMQEPDTSYDGCWRYVNLGPVEVRRRLESETDPTEREALRTAFEYWRMNEGYSSAFEAGHVDRGEPREAVVAGSVRELATSGERVQHVYSMGSLRVDGPPSMDADGGKFLGIDVIDYGLLADWQQQEGLPEGDWF